jgi:hypothetical protein
MMLRAVLERSSVALVLILAAGCAAAPRQRPVKVGEVSEGAGSVASARKFLQGRWSLESFEVFPPGKAPIVLKGAGTLNYDDFGNLRIEIRADQKTADLLRAAGIETSDGTISSDGRAAVDMQNRTLTYILDGQKAGVIPTTAPGPLALSRPRHWEVKEDLLILSTRDDAGKIVLSTGRWRRMP